MLGYCKNACEWHATPIPDFLTLSYYHRISDLNEKSAEAFVHSRGR